ncbi:MAG: DUF1330 domain-containing protein [Pseudomonadota bacterium]
MEKSIWFAAATGLAGMAIGAVGACIALAGPEAAAEDAAPAKPAYMIVTGVVHDYEAFGAGYAAKLPPLYEKHGGRYLAIGSGPEVLEGDGGYASYVIAEWPSVEAARAFWDDPDYVAARTARIEGGWGEFDVFLVEGLAAPTQVAPLAEEAASPSP